MGILTKIMQALKLAAKPTRELPPGYAIREFGPEQRQAIDEILGPLRAVGSKVDPDDRDIFTAMRNTFNVNPDARTRFLFTPEGQVAGGYQLASRDKGRYIPNVAVAEQGNGYGRMLMNHAIDTREAPTFLISAPGKEGFYRKAGLSEKSDDGISSFHFRQGGLVQYSKEKCSCQK